MFDLYTHGTGPGLVSVVVNSLKSYLGWYVDTKLNRELPVYLNKKCSLEVYINKIKAIFAKVVCDQEEGTEDNGRLKKMVEEVAKLMKEKKKKPNVKYTNCKSSAMTSKQSMDKVTISSDEESGEELCTLGEENFSTLTSYNRQQQYRLPEKTRTDSKFGAKRHEGGMQCSAEDPMKSLKDPFNKVSKKMSEQETLIKKLKLSNEAQKKKLAELGDVRGDVPGVVSMTKKKSVPKEGKFGRKPLEGYNEWAMSHEDRFVPVGMLKGGHAAQAGH